MHGTHSGFEDAATQPPQTGRKDIPLVVQILSTLLFGGFAIATVAIAFNYSWPAAILLAAFLGWRGGFAPQLASAADPVALSLQARAVAPEAAEAPRPCGNTSFDAYRSAMLDRLEQEQSAFEGFLERLRKAKDIAEFDRFMDDRAKRMEPDGV